MPWRSPAGGFSRSFIVEKGRVGNVAFYPGSLSWLLQFHEFRLVL